MPLRAHAHTERVFTLLGKRWTGLIVDLLLQRPARFSELAAAVPELSKRVLAERLTELADAGLVAREEGAGRQVTYRLTERGRGLGPAMAELRIWGGSPEPPPSRQEFVQRAGAGGPPADRAVWEAFSSAARGLQDALDQQVKAREGIPAGYLEVVAKLNFAPGHRLRMSELAAATRFKPSRLTHAVGRLVDAGWVRREDDPADGRATAAVLTEAGLAAVARVQPDYTGVLYDHLFSVLEPAECAQLRALCEKVLDSLNKVQS